MIKLYFFNLGMLLLGAIPLQICWNLAVVPALSIANPVSYLQAMGILCVALLVRLMD